jgi:hypothetical protein
MPKIVIKHEGTPIAEVSVDARIFENISAPQAVRLMAEGHVSLEVTEEDKTVFINSTSFACVVVQLLQGEKIRCVPPSTSATPG